VSPHPQHTGRAPLTREEILGRALAIIDAEGTGALSMRRLASEFDVEAMALYYHFPNKRAILDGVVGAAVIEATGGAPLPQSSDWRVTMRAGILMVRSAMLAHPNIAPLVISSEGASPEAAVWVEGPLTILHAAGLRGADLVAAYHQLVAYVFGWHLLASEKGGVWRGPATDRALDESVTPVSIELGDALADWDAGFEEGLDAIITGIDAAVKRARAAAQAEA